MRYRMLPWILFIGVLCACAAPGGAPLHAQGDLLLPARLEFVDAAMEPIRDGRTLLAPGRPGAMPRAHPPQRLWLVLGHTDGRPAGPAAQEALLRFPLQREPPPLEQRSFRGFELNLGFVARSLARSARPLQLRPEDRQLAVHPQEARISRLVFGALDSLQYPMAAVVGLRDGATGEQRLLLYADRPCRITGGIDLSRTGTFVDAHPASKASFTGIFEHDVDIPQAGLHWLAIRSVAPGRFIVTRVDAPAQASVFVLLSALAASGE